MKRGSVPFALVLVLLVALMSGCVQTTELNPDTLTEEEASTLENYTGNIKLVGKDGIIYKAQTLKSAEGDFFHLMRVEVIDDGVISRQDELVILKEDIVDVELHQTNKWVTAGGLAGISLLILVLYYQINGSF